MTVQSLATRQRKGKVIVGAGWFEDGSIRYVIYEDARKADPRTSFAPESSSPPKDIHPPASRRGALAAEQADLFGRT